MRWLLRSGRASSFATVLAAFLMLLVPLGAWAYWSAQGTASASASVAPFTAATLTATPGAGAVELSWTKVTPPGEGSVRYYVTRLGEALGAGSSCPSTRATAKTEAELGARGCSDEPVAVGETRRYTVTAVWRTWTAESSEQSATVTYGPVTQLVLSSAGSELTAGAGENLTITAEDASNRVVENYAGPHTLTFEATHTASPGETHSYVTSESGSPINFNGTGSINFTAGRSVVSGASNGRMTLFDAAPTTITIKDASGHEGSKAFTVKPGAFKSFHVEAVPAEATAGTAFSVKLTAWDEWHNVLTTYARTKKLLYSGAEKSPSETAPVYGSTEPTFAAGTVTVPGFTFYKAASTTLKVEEETTLDKGETTFTVNAEPAGSLTTTTGHFAWVHPKVSAGSLSLPCLFTCEDAALGHSATFKARVAVTDQYGNVVTNLGAGHEVRLVASGGSLVGPTTLTVASEGPAESTAEVELLTQAAGEGTDTLTAIRRAGTRYNRAKATLKY